MFLLILLHALQSVEVHGTFLYESEPEYMAAFENITNRSWSEPLPDALAVACAGRADLDNFNASMTVTLTATHDGQQHHVVSAAEASAAGCNGSTLCIVPPNTTLVMDGNLNLSLIHI